MFLHILSNLILTKALGNMYHCLHFTGEILSCRKVIWLVQGHVTGKWWKCFKWDPSDGPRSQPRVSTVAWPFSITYTEQLWLKCLLMISVRNHSPCTEQMSYCILPPMDNLIIKHVQLWKHCFPSQGSLASHKIDPSVLGLISLAGSVQWLTTWCIMPWCTECLCQNCTL